MRKLVVWMLLFVCVILFIATPLFLTGDNLLNVLLAASVTALLAAGQTYVIILAEIDLSVGAVLGISSIVTAFVLQDGVVYQTYSTTGRGVEFLMPYYAFLDHAPKGRDEDALEFTMAWVRHHDRYEQQPAAKSCCGGGA